MGERLDRILGAAGMRLTDIILSKGLVDLIAFPERFEVLQSAPTVEQDKTAATKVSDSEEVVLARVREQIDQQWDEAIVA